MVPVFTKYGKKCHSKEGAENVAAAPHHGRHELGDGGHAHQDDRHEGQDHVDALAQEDLGVDRVCLQCLLFLLVELQLSNARLAGLQGFLGATGRARMRRRLDGGPRAWERLRGCARRPRPQARNAGRWDSEDGNDEGQSS